MLEFFSVSSNAQIHVKCKWLEDSQRFRLEVKTFSKEFRSLNYLLLQHGKEPSHLFSK